MNFISLVLFFITIIYFTGCATGEHPNEVKVDAKKAKFYSKNEI